MNASRENYYRALFATAAVYDLVLGLISTSLPARAYSAWADVPGWMPHLHVYMILLAVSLLVTSIACILIARGDLRRNADLIFVGALYKLASAGTVVYFLLADGAPYPWDRQRWLWNDMWMSSLPHPMFAIVLSLGNSVFFLLMAECWWCLKKDARPTFRNHVSSM